MASTLQSYAQAIKKLNNLIYSCLISSHPTIVSEKWRHDTSQNWHVLAKTYNDISNEQINEAKLSRLNFYISTLGYLEEIASRFKELAIENKDNGENEDEDMPMSNSE